MYENYEQLQRDPSLPADVRTEWSMADAAEQRYRAEGERIANDSDLTEDARRRMLLDLHADKGLGISERKKALREDVRRRAAKAEKDSWPRPKGMVSLEPTDSSDLIASQNVENVLVSDIRDLQRRAEQNKLPFAPDAVDYLRGRYEAALEMGGVAGAAQVRGVVGAANRLGVSVEDVVGPLRTEREEEALEKAHRLMAAANSIGTVVEPHRSVQRNRQGPRRINERRGSGAAVFMPGGGPPIAVDTPTHTGDTKRQKRAKAKKK